VREINFGEPDVSQAGIYLDTPDEPSTHYHQDFYYFAWAFRPRIERVALIGSGGGVLARDLLRLADKERWAAFHLDLVDIDEAVVRLGRKYLGAPQDSDRVRTHIADGRAFLQRGGTPYDLVVYDAMSSGKEVPSHLNSREAFRAVWDRLSEGGVLALNVFARLERPSASDPSQGMVPPQGSADYLSLLKTLHQVFGTDRVIVFSMARLRSTWAQGGPYRRDNLVILAVKGTGRLDAKGEGLPASWVASADVFGRPHPAYWEGLLVPPVANQVLASYQSSAVLTDDLNPYSFFNAY
jgi:SAM-dependent methyltransferase